MRAETDAEVGGAASDAIAPSPREERRRLRVATTRNQVLDAAERAFASVGYYNTTIKAVAEQCEIAVGTMYQLFDDKESVYQAVLRRRGDALRGLVETRASAPGPSDVLLVDIAELQVHFFRDHPHWTKVASGLVSGSRAALTSPESSEIYEVGMQFVADVVAGVITRGQLDHQIRDGEPHALAHIYLGMLEAFHRIDNGAGSEPTDFGLTQFLELLHTAFARSASPESRT